ncbi:LLM class flavin-dependent oxidoreductase [Actinoallomurus oryzae]|uniref:LLM class flavin-dependent oxidoreductase n=1 Tax=Actinoallomurus oryzae TaxID=502180 RepID=UPI003CD064DE
MSSSTCCAWSGSPPRRSTTTGSSTRYAAAFTPVRPDGRVPVYFGGASADAIRVGGEHADVYAFWGEPLAGIAERIAERIAEVRAAAAPYGRDPRFSVSLRPIPAATETEAWPPPTTETSSAWSAPRP